MIILFVFSETKIIKKADSYNRNQPNFLFIKISLQTKIYFLVQVDAHGFEQPVCLSPLAQGLSPE
jgi:hypothetical protein